MTTPTKKRTSKREANPNAIHYVDNVRFFEEMKRYHELYTETKLKGLPKPRLSNYAGECFMKIAERLSTSPVFRNYPFREEMVAHGIENCVMYAHNFDPGKTHNPFAYFTQVTYFAFFRKMQDEKKQMYVKAKLALQSPTLDVLAAFQDPEQAEDVSGEHTLELNTTYLEDFVKRYEEGLARRRDKRKERATGIDQFMDDGVSPE